MGTFSRRHGHRVRREITVREDAPEALRAGLIGVLREMGMNYTQIREQICPVLRTVPNPINWTEVPNVRDEVTDLLYNCEWFKIYDISEAMYRYWSRQQRHKEFAGLINELFEELGIGWQMIDGQIVTRGPEEFEHAVADAVARVERAGYQTPKAELEEARRDLSRRPDPDITGTIQHCMAALECTARIVSGDDRATLGELLSRQPPVLGIPRPLDQALEKAWGYASEMARHIREGRIPAREDAELLLTMSAGVISYLVQRHRNA